MTGYSVTGEYCPACGWRRDLLVPQFPTLAEWTATRRGNRCGECGDYIMPEETDGGDLFAVWATVHRWD